MTNGDRIRAMSDEQLADFLNNITEDEGLVGYCQNKKICEDKLDRDDVIPYEWCRQCLVDWVKKEVSNDQTRQSRCHVNL